MKQGQLPKPSNESEKISDFVKAIKQLVESGVFIEEIKRRADATGWSRGHTNRALRTAGIRQRGERSDMGAIRSELHPEVEADRILKICGYDEKAALSFLNEIRVAVSELSKKHSKTLK